MADYLYQNGGYILTTISGIILVITIAWAIHRIDKAFPKIEPKDKK